MRLILAGILLVGFLGGCTTTGEIVGDIDWPLVELQKLADSSLPFGRQGVSRNGREFVSRLFKKDKGGFSSGESEPVAYQAKIVVLGDRRPYSIQVQVTKLKRLGNNEYAKVGYDQGLSRVIRRRIQKELHQGRDRRNIIDDFRVF